MKPPHLITKELNGPLAVILGQRGWITEPARFTIGSTADGQRVRLAIPSAEAPGVGSFSADVQLPGSPRTVQLGEDRWEVLVAERQSRELEVEGAPFEAVGFRFSATPAPLSKVAWMTEIFIGSPAAKAFGAELDAAMARPPFEPWTAERVMAHVVGQFETTFADCHFTRDGPFGVNCSTTRRGNISLDFENLWVSVADDPVRVESALRDRLNSFREVLSPTPVTRDQVLVATKSTAQVHSLRSGTKDLLADPIAGDAWAVYVLDRPMSMEMLGASTLEELGVSRDELPALAAANLWRSQEAFQVHGIPGRTHLMVTCGGNYEASLLAVPDFWRSIDSVLGESYVVATPSRDVLLIAPLSQPDLVTRVRDLANQIHGNGAYSISTQLLTRAGGSWRMHSS